MAEIEALRNEVAALKSQASRGRMPGSVGQHDSQGRMQALGKGRAAKQDIRASTRLRAQGHWPESE